MIHSIDASESRKNWQKPDLIEFFLHNIDQNQNILYQTIVKIIQHFIIDLTTIIQFNYYIILEIFDQYLYADNFRKTQNHRFYIFI